MPPSITSLVAKRDSKHVATLRARLVALEPTTVAEEISMPTTLPVRRAVAAQADELIIFAKTLFCFYVAIALLIATLIAIEYDLGMFKGLTLVESALSATSTGLPYSDRELIGMF